MTDDNELKIALEEATGAYTRMNDRGLTDPKIRSLGLIIVGLGGLMECVSRPGAAEYLRKMAERVETDGVPVVDDSDLMN